MGGRVRICVPNHIPQNLCVGALTHNVTIFGDRAFRKYLRLNQFLSAGSLSDRTGGLTRRRERFFFPLHAHVPRKGQVRMW